MGFKHIPTLLLDNDIIKEHEGIQDENNIINNKNEKKYEDEKKKKVHFNIPVNNYTHEGNGLHHKNINW